MTTESGRSTPSLKRPTSEVLPAGLGTLDREEAAFEAILRQRVQEALKDQSPAIPADEIFAQLRAHHNERVKLAKRSS